MSYVSPYASGTIPLTQFKPGAVDSSPQPLSGMLREFARLDKQVAELHDIIGAIFNKVNDYTRPEPANVEGCGACGAATAVNCQASIRLGGLADRVGDANTRLRELLDRLDI